MLYSWGQYHGGIALIHTSSKICVPVTYLYWKYSGIDASKSLCIRWGADTDFYPTNMIGLTFPLFTAIPTISSPSLFISSSSSTLQHRRVHLPLLHKLTPSLSICSFHHPQYLHRPQHLSLSLSLTNPLAKHTRPNSIFFLHLVLPLLHLSCPSLTLSLVSLLFSPLPLRTYLWTGRNL